ncbi:preprotein translocase subunit SecG [Puniceicoccales bacterium CK1056]|uniref:Protein-export membrane protein SecG n=1 Tax=Oceanipulchritudo coccoides TaxID=2706888 RepID=A0A6B2M352_9BACT|nr:preprotein translocase subunit SecG [Oceanipulchritudo coccoides]NDV62524.1 preprotein translocase subunit SecG [Oceanipulchritudo coccoides]
MVNIIISFLTFVLILTSLFLVLVILMQRANSNAGMGSAFGGGVTESAFGAETTNILTRATKWSAIAFFVIALVLYLLYMSREGRLAQTTEVDLPDIPVVVETAPAEEMPVIADEEAMAGMQATAEEATQTVAEEAESLSQEAAELPPVEEPVSTPAP